MSTQAMLLDGPAQGETFEIDGFPGHLKVDVRAELPRSRWSRHRERRRRRFVPVTVTYRLLAASGAMALYEYVEHESLELRYSPKRESVRSRRA